MTAGYLVGPGEGDSVWSIGGRFTRKVGGDDSADRLSILEAVVTRTSEPRRHIHHRESRILVVTSPAGFERFVFDLGVPATEDDPSAGLSLPPADVILPVADRYGIEIVGPPIRSEGD